MADFLLDTDTASRLMRAERPTVNAMRRSGASSISVSEKIGGEIERRHPGEIVVPCFVRFRQHHFASHGVAAYVDLLRIKAKFSGEPDSLAPAIVK